MEEYEAKLLKINLSNETIKEALLSPEVLKKYIGGSGLAAKLMYDRIKKKGKIEPFSEENALIFTVGPLTGTRFPFSSRYFVSAISPLTNIWGQASSGGFFGPELRRTGYYGVVIEGKSDYPVYISIEDENVEIKDASYLWGKTTYETQEILKKEIPNAKIACIGPAGENLVKYAAIINDGGRAAGRTGLGAVMGFKKLKAIVVKGSKKPPIENVEKFQKVVKESITAAMNSSAREILHKYGTSGMLEALVELGDTPIKNFTMGEWDREKVQNISGQTMAKTVLRKQYHCEACPVGCGRIVELPNKEKKIVDGPEYETVAAFGTLVLNDDLVTILKANYMCNAYGLDTISTGVTIAFTIECVERGILSETDGLEISWGNDKAILQLIEKIAKREGIGNSLAEGVKNMAQQLNKESDEFAMHVKGLELPMHDPRAFESWALAYATSNRGACHTYASTYYIEKGLTFPEIGLPEPLDRFETKSKPRAVKLIQDMCEFLDAQVMCRFCLYGGTKLPTVIKALNAVTGEEITIEEAMKIGERIFNTKRVINNLQGIRREHDNLPPRIFKPLDPPGGSYGHVPELNHNLQEYYRLRGWNEDGTVSNEKLRELEIE